MQKEMSLSQGTPGGQEQYRTSLCMSFLFKFHTETKAHLLSEAPPQLNIDLDLPFQATQVTNVTIVKGAKTLKETFRKVLNANGALYTPPQCISPLSSIQLARRSMRTTSNALMHCTWRSCTRNTRTHAFAPSMRIARSTLTVSSTSSQ